MIGNRARIETSTDTYSGKTSPVKSRALSTVNQDILPEGLHEILSTKVQHVGKLVNGTEKGNAGLGTVVMIAKDMALASLHCIQDEKPPTYIRLNTTEGFHDKGEAFKIEALYPSNSPEARDLHLLCGERGDAVLLKVLANEAGKLPGDLYGFTPLEPVRDEDLKEQLCFIGNSSGSHTKVSTESSEALWLPLEACVRAGLPLDGCSFEGPTRSGSISQDCSEGGAVSVRRLSLESPRKEKTIRFETDGGEAVCVNTPQTQRRVLGTKVGVSPQKDRDYGKDFRFTTHALKDGASGGIYVTQSGKIVGIHCGQVPHPQFGTMVNLMYVPTVERETEFDSVSLQGKQKQKNQKWTGWLKDNPYGQDWVHDHGKKKIGFTAGDVVEAKETEKLREPFEEKINGCTKEEAKKNGKDWLRAEDARQFPSDKERSTERNNARSKKHDKHAVMIEVAGATAEDDGGDEPSMESILADTKQKLRDLQKDASKKETASSEIVKKSSKKKKKKEGLSNKVKERLLARVSEYLIDLEAASETTEDAEFKNQVIRLRKDFTALSN